MAFLVIFTHRVTKQRFQRTFNSTDRASLESSIRAYLGTTVDEWKWRIR